MHGSGWHSYISASGERPKITRQLLNRVFTYAWPYRKHIAGMLVMILISSGLTLIAPLIMRDLIDRTLPNRDLNRLMLLSAALLVVPLVRGGVSVLQRRYNAVVGEGVIYDLRVALYHHLQRMSLRFFTQTRVGELMSRLNNDVIGAQNAISSTIVGMVTDIIQGIAVLFVMFTLEWRLTLISILILPLFIFSAQRLGDRLRIIARRQMDLNAEMNAMMSETLNIGGALLVKIFGRTQQEVARFSQRAAGVRDGGIQRAVFGAVFIMVVGLVSAVGSALVYSIGGYLVIRESLTIGTIVALGSYLGSLYSALSGLANIPVELATSLVSFERVFEVLDLPQEIAEKPNPVRIHTLRGRLTFENVAFQYDIEGAVNLSEVERHGKLREVDAVLSGVSSSELAKPASQNGTSQARDWALEDISFDVLPGQLVALVGPSGAGKTTLSYLIPRLYDPVQGRILLDDVDLRDLNLEDLSAQIGMVTQESYLFHDTIRANLLFARPDATLEQMEAAARAANIHDFIAELPNGYDTIVGERGYRLSGGEKQRVALARVILKDSRILILDEATSHLDSESEALIQQALRHILAGRTSIVIAHRLSTILAADQILVFDRGRIVERGRHAELLEMGGVYSLLYQTQFAHQTTP